MRGKSFLLVLVLMATSAVAETADKPLGGIVSWNYMKGFVIKFDITENVIYLCQQGHENDLASEKCSRIGSYDRTTEIGIMGPMENKSLVEVIKKFDGKIVIAAYRFAPEIHEESSDNEGEAYHLEYILVGLAESGLSTSRPEACGDGKPLGNGFFLENTPDPVMKHIMDK